MTGAVPAPRCPALSLRQMSGLAARSLLSPPFYIEISIYKLGASKEQTIPDKDDGKDTPERCQSPDSVHWATCWCGELDIRRLRKPLPMLSGSFPLF